MVYNMTGVENATSILGVFQGVNTASGGILAYMGLCSIFLILLFGLLRNNPVPESFTAASTVTTLVTLIFLYLELVTVAWLIGFTVLWAVSAISLYRSKSA